MLIPAKIDSLNDLDKFNELKKYKYIVKICFSFIQHCRWPFPLQIQRRTWIKVLTLP